MNIIWAMNFSQDIQCIGNMFSFLPLVGVVFDFAEPTSKSFKNTKKLIRKIQSSKYKYKAQLLL